MFLHLVSAEQCCGHGDGNKLDGRNDVCDRHRGIKPNRSYGYPYPIAEPNSEQSGRECGISNAQPCLTGSGYRLGRGILDYTSGFGREPTLVWLGIRSEDGLIMLRASTLVSLPCF